MYWGGEVENILLDNLKVKKVVADRHGNALSSKYRNISARNQRGIWFEYVWSTFTSNRAFDSEYNTHNQPTKIVYHTHINENILNEKLTFVSLNITQIEVVNKVSSRLTRFITYFPFINFYLVLESFQMNEMFSFNMNDIYFTFCIVISSEYNRILVQQNNNINKLLTNISK